LISKLVASAPETDLDWVMICDDDFELAHGSLRSLVAIADLALLDIAQPSHVASSYWSHPITIERIASIARVTNFVEIGPVVVVRANHIGMALADSEHFGMGWGLDLTWTQKPWRMGIADAVAVCHLSPVGEQYSTAPERARVAELAAVTGFTYDDVHTVAVWRPWRLHAPWT
jgi:hypothetical protein